jgi:YfiH family protein
MNPILDNHGVDTWSGLRIWDGFLGREGGVSQGPYGSANFSYLAGDFPYAVHTNWQRLRACFPSGVEFVQVHQVHGNHVHMVDADSRGITAVVLGILTADCVPILLIDEQAGVAGALHAGWRGVIANIASAGVCAMASIGARPGRIRAALGPAIGACCFEVEIELARRFEVEIANAGRHIYRASQHKAFIDLKGLVRGQLMGEGLGADSITDVATCTRCSSERYFSRRAAKGGTTGLQLSFIGITE